MAGEVALDALALAIALAAPFVGAYLGGRVAKTISLRRGQGLFLLWAAGGLSILVATILRAVAGRGGLQVLPCVLWSLLLYAVLIDLVLVRILFHSPLSRRLAEKERERKLARGGGQDPAGP